MPARKFAHTTSNFPTLTASISRPNFRNSLVAIALRLAADTVYKLQMNKFKLRSIMKNLAFRRLEALYTYLVRYSVKRKNFCSNQMTNNAFRAFNIMYSLALLLWTVKVSILQDLDTF